MIILPAIDLRHGKCVNLIQGHAHKETVFSDYPIDIAKQWEEQGAEYLHLVDLDGAFQDHLKILESSRKLSSQFQYQPNWVEAFGIFASSIRFLKLVYHVQSLEQPR